MDKKAEFETEFEKEKEGLSEEYEEHTRRGKLHVERIPNSKWNMIYQCKTFQPKGFFSIIAHRGTVLINNLQYACIIF